MCLAFLHGCAQTGERVENATSVFAEFFSETAGAQSTVTECKYLQRVCVEFGGRFEFAYF